MPHSFSIGDTAKLRRTGLEVEIIDLHPTDTSRVLCGWFDDEEEWQEVLFSCKDLLLVRAKKMPNEVKTGA